jgi:hypothetical protein
MERHVVTTDTIAVMLREDRQFARECETPGAAVTATMGLAKLYGLLTDKTQLSGPDGGNIKIETIDVSKLSADALREIAGLEPNA